MGLKKKIIVGCLFVMIIMTAYPPQNVKKYFVFGTERSLQSERLEYHFIGSDLGYDEQSTIAFDRLLLQYVIVIGIGYMIFLFKTPKPKS